MLNRRRLLKTLGVTAGAGVLGVAGLAYARGNRYYQGPVSGHFDGTHFFNPGGPQPRGLPDLLRWQLGESAAEWPDRFPSPYRDRPPHRVYGASLRVSYVGHASFLLQTAGLNILTDPVWSERASPVAFAGPRRVNDPGIAFDDLPPIDVVLLSHNHYDHLDILTLARLSSVHRPHIITPLGNDTIIAGDTRESVVRAVDWGDLVELDAGVRVYVEPMQHWSARGPFDRRHALWAAFVVEGPAGRVYVVGDSGLGDGRTFGDVGARHAPIRLALLPIGAYEPRWFMKGQHMNPDDAVRALRLCGAEQAIAHHWGTFQLTDEPVDEPPQLLGEALERHAVEPSRFLVLRPGEVWAA
jgi:L-ascorbate metabolism protein UlaG (beta-lactamase superfamily)